MNTRVDEVTARDSKTKLERKSDQELVVTRRFDAPARALFQAWSRSELFSKWWVPKSSGLTLLSCEMDVRVGGAYRLEFPNPTSGQPMAFFGRYIEVVPDKRIAWTNEESEGGAVTTVTFDEEDGRTMLTISNRFSSKEACDAELASGATDGMDETLNQLEEILVAIK